MDNSQHTPGPWKATWHNGGRFLSIRSGEFVGVARVNTTNVDRDANARLIAAAPAMDMALEMIACGAARIERIGSLTEFCFDGIRYSHNGDWGAMMNVIGWGKARAAIAAATGESQ